MNDLKKRHVQIALDNMDIKDEFKKFIIIENSINKKEITPIVSFTIQSDPISEVGINGIQALDILKYNLELFKSLNNTFPCRENAFTITKIEEAIHWQEARTKDRLKRKVEGKNKK